MLPSVEDTIAKTCNVSGPSFGTRRSLALILVGASLSGFGCGKEIIPIPVPCPPCEDTAESSCSYIELDDGTRIRTQYTPGDQNLPLVIGVPGLGGTYQDVSIVFPQGSFSTLSLSLPGGLCSDCLPTGTVHTVAKGTDALEKLIEHYASLLDQFGRKNVLLVGGSFGAFVVEDYCARHPASEISAVIIAGQDTPLSGSTMDAIEGYLKFVDFFFPLTDNSHLQQYLASLRVFDVSEEIVHTQNRWLIIGTAEDDLVTGAKAMAERLGERARFAEIPGNHMMTLLNGDNIRNLVTGNLDFLLWK